MVLVTVLLLGVLVPACCCLRRQPKTCIDDGVTTVHPHLLFVYTVQLHCLTLATHLLLGTNALPYLLAILCTIAIFSRVNLFFLHFASTEKSSYIF